MKLEAFCFIHCFFRVFASFVVLVSHEGLDKSMYVHGKRDCNLIDLTIDSVSAQCVATYMHGKH